VDSAEGWQSTIHVHDRRGGRRGGRHGIRRASLHGVPHSGGDVLAKY